MPITGSENFDPQAKEAELQRESQAWDTSHIEKAQPGDIPTIDLDDYFRFNRDIDLENVADQLRQACTQTGFCTIIGHHFPESVLQQAFAEARRFHALPYESKQSILMDSVDWPIKGVGYLPVKNRKLPARNRGNLNESFVLKRDHHATLDDNQWPVETMIPCFRQNIELYIKHIKQLSMRLLPIYARALDLDKDFFKPAFTAPLYRMRLTRYPKVEQQDADEYGIAPHVDTTFFTILAQKSPGLVIHCETRQCWIHAPVVENAFIVNSGELLKHWSNDRFISVKHFANNNASDEARFSIPFFFNANADYRMECLPSCCDENNPPKYPAISYLESQAVAQGE